MASKRTSAVRKTSKREAPGKIPSVSSSLATGDYGGRYQDYVDGWLLAQLLMQNPFPGVPGTTVTRVGLQRRVHGALLDDSVVTTDADFEVQLSIKAGIAVAEGDADFRETIGLAWTAQAAGRWTGLVAPPNAIGINAFRQLVFLAQQNDQLSDFLARISTPGVVAARDRKRFGACRNILDETAGAPISDAQFHAFLRQFVVLLLDFDIPPHRDLESVAVTLASDRGITRAQAHALFSGLVAISEETAIAAASLDRSGLESRIRQRHLVAGLAPDLRPLRTALAAYAELTFESRGATVAGVHLDRAHLVRDVEAGLAAGHNVIVTGAPGFGKSTVVRGVVEALAAEGPVLHLSGRRVEMAGSWASLAPEIGLPADRAQLADLLSTHPRGATIVLDAVEHIVSAAARAVVNDLFAYLQAREIPINVVLGVRDLALGNIAWLDLRAVRPLREVTVGGLTDEEAGQIASASPVLGALIARSRKPIPGGLLLLGLLHDARISDAQLAQTQATESDLLDLWWQTVLVGSTDSAHDRLRITLTAAEAALLEPSGFFQLPLMANGATIGSLQRDGVLALDLAVNRYRFGHDIIQDWALVEWLATGSGEPTDRLRSALAIPGYYRAVSLYAQRLAERDPTRYAAMRADSISAGDQRADHAFLCALVLSPRARELLAAHSEALLADDGRQLAALLRIVNVEQIDFNIELFDELRREGYSVGEATTIAASLSLPRAVVWAPLLHFCLEHLNQLGAAHFAFLLFAERWQRATGPGMPLRRRVLAAAVRVLTFFEGWRPHSVGDVGPKIPYADTDAAEKAARTIVAHSTDVDPAFVRAYLTSLQTSGYHDDQVHMLSLLPAVSRTFTDEVVEFGASVLIEPDPQPWEADLAYLGIREHLYFPASDAQGPFLGLLRSNESAGLGLVRALTQRAVEKYARKVESDFHILLRPLTFTFAGRELTLLGEGRMYSWFRPNAHDSSTLTSALMAVETWAIEVIEAGRPVLEIVELLLGEGTSLPFLGIVVGLAYDYPDLIPHLIDLFAQPWLWRLEQQRQFVNMQPTDFNEFLPLEEHLPDYKPYLRKRNAARDAKRVGMRLPMRFALEFLFAPAASPFHNAYLQRVSEMTLTDAALTLDEVSEPERAKEARDVFDDFVWMTKAENYEHREGGTVRLRPRAVDAHTSGGLQNMVALTAMHRANLNGNNALRDYRAPDNPQGFEAVGKLVEELLNAGRLKGDDIVAARETVLRCACVAVTFAGEVASAWAVEQVCTAARAYDAKDWSPDVEDANLMDMRVSVATALGAMLVGRPDDDDVRLLVFRLANRALPDIAKGVLRGVLPLWATRPTTAAAVLSLIIEAAIRKDAVDLVSGADLEAAVAADRAYRARPWPRLAGISRAGVHRIGNALGAMPVHIADPRAIAVLVPLVEALLAVADGATDDGLWLGFNGAVGRLAANIDVGIAGGHGKFRARLADWQRTTELYSEAVAGLVRYHFGAAEIDTAVARFDALVDPFLCADHRAQLARKHLDRDFQNACWALLMTQNFEGLLVPQGWPHVGRFAEHVGRWVTAVGGHPTNASVLLLFLERFAAAFSVGQILDWVGEAIARTAPGLMPAFWNENGSRIAALLLHLVTERPRKMAETQKQQRAAALTEQLLVAGVPAAGELREALEQINRWTA